MSPKRAKRRRGEDLQAAWERGRPANIKRKRPPSSVLSIRISAELFKALSARARAERKTSSEFARELIEAGLASDRPTTPADLAAAFSRWAREIGIPRSP